LETLRACPKARYEDGLDTAKSDVLADVLRQIGCTHAAEILTNLAARKPSSALPTAQTSPDNSA